MTKSSGVLGAAQALSIVALISLSIRTIVVVIVLRNNPVRQLTMLAGPAALALICVLTIESALAPLALTPSWTQLLLMTITLSVAFLTGVWLLDHLAKWRVISTVSQLIMPKLKRLCSR